ncbi:MAG: UDP-N-acetylmuramoyl-L-alanine--D-glutamate ligase [Gammaproteobacteria bacterium]|nr:UDP-N-acetylmuramoyl-L-alanine--D-glutamate ligase [Gammaproteobacteria bacterium]
MSAKRLQKYETVTVLGFGLTGVSCARFLLSQGIRPVILDTRSKPPGLEHAPQLVDYCESHFGPLQLEHLLQSDLVIVSPGIDCREGVIAMAADAGVDMVSDVELFAWFANKPMIAITGSNGKSTVTELCGHILRKVGMQPMVIGNIGTPVLEALLPTAPEHDCYVIELSSFQLELIESLELNAATILNVSSDHLDRYDDERAYARAKQRIYAHAKTCVWNRDDDATRPLHTPRNKQLVSFGQSDATKGFGLTRVGQDFWLTYDNQKMVACADLPIAGIHNWLNVQAALALVQAMGVPTVEAIAALAGYQALPHRCEVVGEFHGVQWIDDSKATNPGAAIAAIEGFRPATTGKLILIMGGDAKGAELGVLGPFLHDQVDVLITLGRDGDKIAALKQGARPVQSLNEAVAYAAQQATDGSVVLLSPACASLDMFSNYKERGEKFRAAVEAWYASH